MFLYGTVEADDRYWLLVCRRPEDHKHPNKYKGIHEPKGRVKGFRVEIRPPNSGQKIWVGTFDTRHKAMRAFDAAVYLTGKEPHYFVYPEKYFPTRPSKPSREYVQTVAKKFADKTDDVKVNPTSCLVDSSKVSSVESSAVGSEQITSIASDVKVVEQITPIASDKVIEKLVDEFLQNEYRWLAPTELFPPVEATYNSLWALDDEKASLEESEAGVKKAKAGTKEAELAAFDRGYNDPDFDLISAFLDQEPPENFLPCIEGESFMPEYKPSRPSSKRKRDTAEGAVIVAEDRISVGLSQSGSDVDDWLIDVPNRYIESRSIDVDDWFHDLRDTEYISEWFSFDYLTMQYRFDV